MRIAQGGHFLSPRAVRSEERGRNDKYDDLYENESGMGFIGNGNGTEPHRAAQFVGSAPNYDTGSRERKKTNQNSRNDLI